MERMAKCPVCGYDATKPERDAGDYYDRKDAERRHHGHLAEEARARGENDRQHREAAERAAYVGD